MPKRQPPADTSVRISATTHARVVLACEALKLTVPEFVERAALASLQRQEQAGRIKAYELACAEAQATNHVTPFPEDFGLPRDFGIPPC